MATENKTKPTAVTVEDFIAKVTPPERQADARVVCEMMTRLSGEPARMWGPSIIGFGSYHYRYDSGREGDSVRIGFAPRKPTLVFYLSGASQNPHLLARLGGSSSKGGCLYIKRLSGLDLPALEALVTASLAYMDEKYPR
jgi:hypothetical protein